MGARWQIYIDRGGTFTDALGVDPASGAVRVAKVLSSDRAPIEAIRALLALAPGQPIPPCDVRMGTTIATNALLERKGARTALVISEGFGDLLRIGDQTRPELFALDVERAEPLHADVLELPARGAPDGRVLCQPDDEALAHALGELRARGVESAAVCVLHAYKDGALEAHIGRAARAADIAHVSLSHEVVGEIGLLARAETAVVDAYVTPLVGRYADALAAELPGSDVRLMQSSGTLCEARALRGRDAVLSGPAGGAVAVARIAEALGIEAAIGFDMGGTSTDVLRYAGELPRVYETRVRSGRGAVRVRAPAVDIHTVAAGGGSVCRVDGERMTVGPQSVGAHPGPLCYGRAGEGGQLALTDVSLALGRIAADRFPFPLDAQAVHAALARMARELGGALDAQRIAAGFFEIAIEHMAEAIRRVSIARGHDVRDHALIAFGGASGQHACALARRLGMRRIVLHPYAGVLSAWGMGGATESRHRERDAGSAPIEAVDGAEVQAAFAALEQALRREQAAPQDDASITGVITKRVDLRYRGTEHALTLDLAPAGELRARFEARHTALFGYTRPGHEIELAVLRAELTRRAPAAPATPAQAHAAAPAAPLRTARLWIGEGWVEAPVYAREVLAAGQIIAGPAIVLEAIGTIVVDPGFTLTLDASGVITLDDGGPAHAPRVSNRASRATSDTTPDPVQLEVMGNRFMSIAEQMGVVLGRTALSTNIRERLDYSCALFDAGGGLVSNAPHIPVHLGAMSETVRAILALHDPAAMRPGDAFCANDPALGGSHLPDITVVSPVFDGRGQLAFFTASRGHHADVGGIAPGSMPPFSTRLEEEGVVFRGERIARLGELDEPLVRACLGRGPHPARDPDQNVADLRAQLAANRKGEQLLRELAQERGEAHVTAYMRHVQRHAELAVRRAVAALPAGEHALDDVMDDGTRIAARVVVHPAGGIERASGPALTIDFSGSSPEVESNLNAPRAVTVAAVIYVLRLLTAAPIPLNSGCLAPIELIVPERSVLCPSRGRAVAAGNVETSQRVVDVLLGALGKLAACQGTMNNLTFGTDAFGYYETIAGGAGASAARPGESAVHTHMTNTRITDPEVLEARFPVQLLAFRVRRGSGGRGRHPGGDGVVRELRALTALRASILSDRRRSRPFGLAGGEPGQPGVNSLNGAPLEGRAALELAPGDVLRIETPGGGGYGSPP